MSDGTLDSTNITEDNSGNELSTDDEYGISYQNTYANGGAITGSATLSSDSKKIIKTSTAYDSKNNYAVSQTDELGNTSSLIYDGNNAAITTGLLTKSTDASGMYYEYGYVTAGR